MNSFGRFFLILLLSTSLFSVRAQSDRMKAAEYFWDTDPGQGNGNPMVATDGSFNQAFEKVSQNISTLPAVGIHSLNIRAEDTTGAWGPIFTTIVTVLGDSTATRADKITTGEYFWDTDPGQGNGSPLLALDGSFNQAFESIYQSNFGLPSIGVHTLNVRAKDIAGNWGSVFTVVVNVEPGFTTIRSDGVVAAEYFFDTDPGQGNGTPMLAQGGSFGNAFQKLMGGNIPSPVTAGMHLLSMRSKDIAGNWGSLFSIIVNIDTTITAPVPQISGPVALCTNALSSAAYTTPFVSGGTYTWSITGGAIISGSGTNSVSVNWNGAGPYLLKVTACVSAFCNSDSVTPVVNHPVTSNISYTICAGQFYSGHNAGGMYIDTFTSYTGCDSIRNLNLIVLAGHSSISESICQGQSYAGHSQTGIYTDTLSGSYGCDSIRTLNLTVLAGHSSISESICQGQSYAGHNQTGLYTDTLTGSYGCDSLVTINLFVDSIAIPTITRTNDTLRTEIYDAYQWLLNNVPLNGDTAQSVTIVQDGDYSVIVTNASSCTDTSPAFNVTDLGVVNITFTYGIKIYPNPNNGKFYVRFTSPPAGTCTIRMYDIAGKLVWQGENSEIETMIDCTELSAGIYTCEIISKEFKTTNKIVVQ